MARSFDEGRPVLTGIHARDGWIEATDGHRLHVAPNEHKLPAGIWAVGTPRTIEGNYPDTGKVIAPAEPEWHYRIAEPQFALAIARAAVAAAESFSKLTSVFVVEIPVPGGAKVRANPKYVHEVLAGMQGPTEVFLHVSGPHSPITFFARNLKRAAVIMPIRLSDKGPRAGTAFSIEPFLAPITKAVAA